MLFLEEPEPGRDQVSGFKTGVKEELSQRGVGCNVYGGGRTTGEREVISGG